MQQLSRTVCPDVNVIPVDNTAVAAQMVAQSGRKDVAALSSRACAELYGLDCLRSSVQDQGNNRTRFICISRNLEIYPGSDRTSIMMVLNHKPGALYKVLARLYTLGINVTKLESRPIPDREFEFMFYFDLETSIYSEEFVQLMCELDEMCEEFKYLGSYTRGGLMKCGLLGRKLGHSYSPQIHACLADYSYTLFEKEPEEVADFLKNGDFTGLNVTIPYKKAVIPYLDELSPSC